MLMDEQKEQALSDPAGTIPAAYKQDYLPARMGDKPIKIQFYHGFGANPDEQWDLLRKWHKDPATQIKSDIICKDDDGLPHGPFLKYYPDTNIEYVIREYNHGTEIGNTKEFHRNGQQWRNFNFNRENGSRHGQQIEFNADGQKLNEVYFLDGEMIYDDADVALLDSVVSQQKQKNQSEIFSEDMNNIVMKEFVAKKTLMLEEKARQERVAAFQASLEEIASLVGEAAATDEHLQRQQAAFEAFQAPRYAHAS